MSKVLEILKMGKQILTPEDHWTQGSLALSDDLFVETQPHSPDAVCWCLVGAIQKAGYVIDDTPSNMATCTALMLLDDLSGIPHTKAGENRRCAEFNDTHTHGEVLALIDKAIEVQERQPW
jgi:hypothetical protein